MLNNWNLKNPGGKEKAAARGTAIHQACEDYIRGLPINLPDEYLPFWRGLSQHLDKYDYFVWSEKPLRPEGTTAQVRTASLEFGHTSITSVVALI